MTRQAAQARTTVTDGSDIGVGDVILILGRPRLVDRLTPASERTRAIYDDPGARLAHSGRWTMTLHRGLAVHVLPAPPERHDALRVAGADGSSS